MRPPKTSREAFRYPPASRGFFILTCFLLVMYLWLSVYSLLDGQTTVSPLNRTFSAAVVCLTAYVGAWLSGHSEAKRQVLWLCFLLFLHLILTFTLFDTGIRRQVMTDRAFYTAQFVNLRPFETIRNIYFRGYRHGWVDLRYLLLNFVGNVVAFMPFALFLPRLFPRLAGRLWKFFLCMLSLVCAIEALQCLFMCGSCDVDDVILNVGGSLLMYGLLAIPSVGRLADRLFPRDGGDSEKGEKERKEGEVRS